MLASAAGEVSVRGEAFLSAEERVKSLRQALGPIVALLIGAKIELLLWFAWNRRFVTDEFDQLNWSKYVGHGFFETIWPVKSVGYAVFFDFAHLIGWDARSILLLGRMETALLACGTLALVYAIARSLGQSQLRAALILLVLLSFSNFIERIFETRAEPLATFFGAAALLAAMRSEGRRWRIVGAGVLSGLAFLSTQKAIYFDAALGLALVGDATLARRHARGIARGAWLVLGWLVPVAIYCFAFGGSDPVAVAQNLVFGPMGVASPETATEYGGLRHFVVQTLTRNALLYVFCFVGMVLASMRVVQLDGTRRIALIFSVVVTAFVFAHNQPWPYVFVMALPFMALWALEPLDVLAGNRLYLPAAWTVLGIAIAASFVSNLLYLHIDNRAQLALVARAEKLVAPGDMYFDGIGMLPNRREPSTLWLDRHAVLQTLRERRASEAYRIFATAPPKLILWSYRMDAIEPVVGPLIRNSYVRVAPNIRMAGAALIPSQPVTFDAPIAGTYALYDLTGRPVQATLEVDGRAAALPLRLRRGEIMVTLRSGAGEGLLLPQGSYVGRFSQAADDKMIFADVYR